MLWSPHTQHTHSSSSLSLTGCQEGSSRRFRVWLIGDTEKIPFNSVVHLHLHGCCLLLIFLFRFGFDLVQVFGHKHALTGACHIARYVLLMSRGW